MPVAVAALLLALPQELERSVLEKVKAASAYVVVDGPRGQGTGSGFLFLRRGQAGYVITCEHVVRGAETVKLVFGSGTGSERSLEGKVIAVDDDRDLACVLLKGVADLPAPLELGKETSVAETQAVYVAGFPFGQMLAAGDKNPEISISKAAVSSVRRDVDKRITSVQLSGDVNPGNSGGPAIDAKGRVIGVARAKILGSSTAFCIPPEEIHGFLKGRVKSSSFAPAASTPTSAKFEVALGLVDPLATLKGAGIAWCPEEALAVPPEAGKDGWTKIHPSMKTLALKIDEDQATGTLDVPRPAGGPASITLLVQATYTTSDGKTHWTEPSSLQVEFADAGAPAGKADPKEAPPAPVPGKGSDIPVGDDVKIAAALRLKAVVSDLILSPDGGALYALDLSEGRLLRLKPDTLEVVAHTEVIEDAVAMCVTPDGRTIYVAGRDPSPQKPSGRIQTIPTTSLKPSGNFVVPFAFHRIAATSGGLLAATGVGQRDGFAVVDVSKRNLLGSSYIVYGGSSLRLHPDQTRAYTGDWGLSPGDYRCTSLKRNARNQYETYDSPYHGDHPLGGNFEITPDGRYLLGCAGSVLRLGKTKDADLRFVGKIDPGIAIGVARGSNTFVVANAEGFLKVYDLEKLELKKSIKVGVLCMQVALDASRGRLHAVISPVPADASSRGGWFDYHTVRAGDIASFSLTGK